MPSRGRWVSGEDTASWLKPCARYAKGVIRHCEKQEGNIMGSPWFNSDQNDDPTCGGMCSMSPNPSTVYAEEFDDRDGQTLVVDDSGHVVLSGLADGSSGGNGDDILSADLDSATEIGDTNNDAELLAYISQLENDCQLAESILIASKASTAEAKSTLDAATEKLRRYIRSLSIPMPLFDGVSNDSPAGESNLQSSEVGDDSLGIGAFSGDSKGAPWPRVSVKNSQKTWKSLKKTHDAVGAGGGEGWKDVELMGIFPTGIAKKFEVEGLFTLGQLSSFLNSGKSYHHIKGIGQLRQETVENSLEAFWQSWESKSV